MPDNSILWISANGVNRRQMVERANGSEVYARFPWDAPPPSPSEAFGHEHPRHSGQRVPDCHGHRSPIWRADAAPP
jgi:hypothetical protein